MSRQEFGFWLLVLLFWIGCVVQVIWADEE